MSGNDIPDDIMRAANEKAVERGLEPNSPWAIEIARAVFEERNRWIASAESVEPQNEEQARLLDALIRRTKGEPTH